MSDTASTTITLNIDEVMRRLGAGRARVYTAIASGKLPAKKLGRRTVVVESDLRAFIESLPRMGDGTAA
jgi:excisionase family DNA binding protein